jgi:hypothetical protein
MKTLPFRYLLCLGPLSVACSSGGVETRPDAPGVALPRSTETAGIAVPAVRIRTLSTIPNSACTVPGHAPGESKVPTVYADDYGELSVSYSKVQTGGDRLLLDCAAPSGQHQTIDVDAAPEAVRHALSDPLAAGHRLRPALSGDPLSYSQAEIRALGFPPRPDATKSPGRYANWLKMATRTMEYVPAAPGGREGAKFSPNLGTSPNWAGGQFQSTLIPYQMVEAEGSFNIPTVTPFSGSCEFPCLVGTGAIWVGLDGNGDGGYTDIVQAGVEFDSYLIESYAFVTYEAWTEYWPAKSVPVPNWTVHADDEFYDLVWVGDESGNLNAQSGTAWFEPVDYSNNQYTVVSAPITNGFAGLSAEWIIEDASGELPNFGSSALYGTFAVDTGDNEWDFANTNSPEEIWMLPGNKILALGLVNSNGYEVDIDWLAGQ